MKNRHLKFSKNWANKLNADVFTTFRMKNSKYANGNVLDVFLAGKLHCQVEVLCCIDADLKVLPSCLTYLDANLSPDEFVKLVVGMYKNYDVDWSNQRWCFYVLRKVKISNFKNDGLSTPAK